MILISISIVIFAFMTYLAHLIDKNRGSIDGTFASEILHKYYSSSDQLVRTLFALLLLMSWFGAKQYFEFQIIKSTSIILFAVLEASQIFATVIFVNEFVTNPYLSEDWRKHTLDMNTTVILQMLCIILVAWLQIEICLNIF